MNQDDKQEYERLLSRAANQRMSESENSRLDYLSKLSINDKKHQTVMSEYKRNVTISSKIDGKIVVSQIDFKDNMVYITEDVNLIFKGDIDTFKRQVADMPDSVYEKSYKEMLSLAEDIESVLSKA